MCNYSTHRFYNYGDVITCARNANVSAAAAMAMEAVLSVEELESATESEEESVEELESEEESVEELESEERV